MQHRQTPIDVLKLVASQAIVLHHLAVYGPVSDALQAAAPRLSDGLFNYGRMAVQIFLVVAGFLAARSLAPTGCLRAPAPWRMVAQRYLRLVPPFLAALLLTIVCSALAGHWMMAEFIPAAPTWGQFLAHGALLHGLLGVDALSAGVWYVAIDFQLFTLMTVLLWLGCGWARAWVLALMLASLFVFNRNEDLDNWAVYFFASYGLGAAAFWASQTRRAGAHLALLALLAGAVALALSIDFRVRILLALGVTLLLGLAHWRGQNAPSPTPPAPPRLARWLEMGGNSSYALFLVHFSVLLLCNVLWVQLGLQGTGALAVVGLGYWAVSLGLALLFERWVEQPLSGLFSFPRPLSIE